MTEATAETNSSSTGGLGKIGWKNINGPTLLFGAIAVSILISTITNSVTTAGASFSLVGALFVFGIICIIASTFKKDDKHSTRLMWLGVVMFIIATITKVVELPFVRSLFGDSNLSQTTAIQGELPEGTLFALTSENLLWAAAIIGILAIVGAVVWTFKKGHKTDTRIAWVITGLMGVVVAVVALKLLSTADLDFSKLAVPDLSTVSLASAMTFAKANFLSIMALTGGFLLTLTLVTGSIKHVLTPSDNNRRLVSISIMITFVVSLVLLAAGSVLSTTQQSTVKSNLGNLIVSLTSVSEVEPVAGANTREYTAGYLGILHAGYDNQFWMRANTEIVFDIDPNLCPYFSKGGSLTTTSNADNSQWVVTSKNDDLFMQIKTVSTGETFNDLTCKKAR